MSLDLPGGKSIGTAAMVLHMSVDLVVDLAESHADNALMSPLT
jgi:hypothetical protein